MKHKQRPAECFFPTVTPNNWSALEQNSRREKKSMRKQVRLSDRVLARIRADGF